VPFDLFALIDLRSHQAVCQRKASPHHDGNNTRIVKKAVLGMCRRKSPGILSLDNKELPSHLWHISCIHAFTNCEETPLEVLYA
jgi:hypothetical protein